MPNHARGGEKQFLRNYPTESAEGGKKETFCPNLLLLVREIDDNVEIFFFNDPSIIALFIL